MDREACSQETNVNCERVKTAALALSVAAAATACTEPPPPALTRECPQCTMSIPVKARRCPQCTSEVPSQVRA